VARLESKQLFLMKTEDGSVYTGTLNTTDTPSGRPMEIGVVESSGKEVLNSARIVEMDTTSTKFLHRFNGNINTDPVQLGLSSELSAGALGRRGQFQLNLVLQSRRYGVDSKPSGT
jgi:hypothetical protein